MKITTLEDIIEDKVNDELYLKKKDFEKRKYLKNSINICCDVVGDRVYMQSRGIKPPQMLKIKRTDEEKKRRSKFGEKGIKFGVGKYLDITSQGYSNTLTTFASDNYVWDKTGQVRELTNKESLLLMDVDSEDCDKIINAVPQSQIRKLAGNSIVVNVLTEMFRELFYEEKTNPEQPLF